jgi:hypothetical protein
MFPYQGLLQVTAFPLSELPDFTGTTLLSDFLPGVWLPRFIITCLSYSSLISEKTRRISQVATIYQCLACQDLRLRRSLYLLAVYEDISVAFCTDKHISLLKFGISELFPFNLNWLPAHNLTIYA